VAQDRAGQKTGAKETLNESKRDECIRGFEITETRLDGRVVFTFSQLEADDEFLEHARVFDNFYGTPRGPVEEALQSGRDVVFDIDWQGAQQLTQAAADDLVKIFILPPNMRELEQRLKTRSQDSDAVIAKRMSKSEAEISHWAEYDYVIVNEDIDTALAELLTIVAAERMRRRRQPWLGGFVKSLISGG